jgi:integrase
MKYKGVSVNFVHNRKKERNTTNEYFIQARITIERKSKYFSIDELPKIHPKYWSGKENRWVKESHPEGSKINSFLVRKVAHLNDYLIESKINHGYITFERIKAEFFKKGSVATFNDFFDHFLDTHKFQAVRTKQAYSTTRDNINEFSQRIPLSSISEKLISDFIEWERSIKKIKDVTIDKHLTHIKTIVKEIVNSGLLPKNPLEHSRFNLKPEKASRTSLNKEEVKKIWTLRFNEEEKHLEKVRDIFIFLCQTGLYYSDVLELKKSNIIENRVIKGTRTKNNHLYIIPLVETTKQILNKYSSESDYIFSGLITEPAFNRHLKKIALKAGIRKNISNKVGRHTFTEVLIASNTLQRSFISKMLGHEKESTTQAYYELNESHFLSQINNFNDYLS